MTDTAPEPAADVLGTPPPLPQGTPALGAATTPPAPAPPPSTPDKDGQVWDARWHTDPPALNAHGRWKKRFRGNAARKAMGLPPTGILTGKGFKPQPEPSAEPAAAPAAPPPEPAPTASQPPPPEILSGQAPPPVKDGVPDAGPDPAALRTLESYAPTAAGLVDGTFGAAQLAMGKAWELDRRERDALTGATQRVLHHYQAPQLGPVLELLLILIPIIGKRRNDPETRSFVGRVLDWYRSRNKPPVASDPYRTMPAAGSSAPAPAAPDVPAAYAPPPPAEKSSRMLAYQ